MLLLFSLKKGQCWCVQQSSSSSRPQWRIHHNIYARCHEQPKVSAGRRRSARVPRVFTQQSGINDDVDCINPNDFSCHEDNDDAENNFFCKNCQQAGFDFGHHLQGHSSILCSDFAQMALKTSKPS